MIRFSQVLMRRPAMAFAMMMSVCVTPLSARDAGTNGPGVTDAAIKIGNTAPYSGPLSSNGVIAKTADAYFRMINESGGINGRKIAFITYDDAYSPPKIVEQTRRLVEKDEVLLLFNQIGTPTNLAIIKYLNQKEIPQLFIASGATPFGDHKTYPWTIGLAPNYALQTRIMGKYIAQEHPNSKIAVLSSFDDFGRDNLKGLREGLGDKAANIVSELTYESAAPTVDSELVQLKNSGADVFVNFSSAKFAAQSIRKAAELGWRPVQLDGSKNLAL